MSPVTLQAKNTLNTLVEPLLEILPVGGVISRLICKLNGWSDNR